MKDSYNFFQNNKCEYFPCHDIYDNDNFNCLFCYCPLSPYEDCGGMFTVLNNGWKDCSNCVIPHYRYDYIVDKLRELHNLSVNKIKENN